MKKLLLMFLAVSFVVFLLPSISAWEFDNKAIYDEDKDTYTVKDSLLGIPTTKVSEISRTGLTKVGATKVYLDFDYILYEDNYANPFKYLRLNKFLYGNWIEGGQVPFEILIKQGTKEESRDTYTENCIQDSKNLSNQICTTSKSGTKSITVDNWIPLDQTKLRSGSYEIRLILEKGIYDEVDWILNLNGKELVKWDFLGNSLVGYWDFDNSNRTTAFNVDNNSINNFTEIIGPGKTSNSKLGAFAMQFNRTDSDQMNTSFDPDNSTLTAFSWSFWINPQNVITEQKIMGHADVAAGSRFMEIEAGFITIAGGNGASIKEATAPITANVYHFIVGSVTNGGDVRIWVDNDNVANTSLDGNMQDNLAPYYLGTFDGAIQFLNATLDEVGYWEVELTADDVNSLYNGGAGLPFPLSSSLSINLDSPINGLLTNELNLNFSGTFTPIELNLTNATLMVYNSSSVLFNETTNIVTGNVVNFTNYSLFNLNVGNYIWNIFVCGINNTGTLCATATNNFTFSVGTEIFANSSSNFTYETAQESYQANLTIPIGETISSSELIYNGIAHTATVTNIVDNNFTLATTIDIPTTAVPSSQWFWQVHFGSGGIINTSANTQPVGAINLSIFGQGSSALPYINFTFQNETVGAETISATFTSTWNYFLGSGAINKTLSFTNASENLNYSFEFHPQNRTLRAGISINYANSESQSRTFNPSTLTLTNSTSLQTLLLLPTSNGIFQQFVTQTLIGATVTNVNFIINRSIGGVPTEITSGATDGSGFVSIFLNPDFTYNALFTKTGFTPSIFSFQPSNQLRTVIMGETTTGVGNGSTISINTSYDITPINSSLNNATDFLFSFTVTSSQPINSMNMNITNSSGFQVGFQSAGSATVISQTINTGENRSFVGTFSFATGNETITVKKVWIIGSEFIGDYSIFRQFTLYLTYDFEDFIRFVLAIALIGGVLIFMAAGETFDTSESKIGVSLLLIWAFSIVGWLTIPGAAVVSANSSITTLAQFSNQYGIAILSTGAGVFFIARRIFT